MGFNSGFKGLMTALVYACVLVVLSSLEVWYSYVRAS